MANRFECRDDCIRRTQLWADSGVQYQRLTEEADTVNVTNLTGAGGTFTVIAINRAYKDTLSDDEGLHPSSYEYGFMGGQPRCKSTPDTQKGCPLPEPGSVRYQEVTVEIARRTIQIITEPVT